METLFRKGIYQILKVFYKNNNSEVHLRELSRRANLNENSVSRFLNELADSKILISKKGDSVRKFNISKRFLSSVFSIFDFEKFFKLSFKRRKSIEDYLNHLKIKPFCLILFGSSAKGHANEKSDLDLLEISETKCNISEISRKIESERGIRLHLTKLKLKNLKEAIKKKDSFISSAINTGFPVFGKDFFYEVIKNE